MWPKVKEWVCAGGGIIDSGRIDTSEFRRRASKYALLADHDGIWDLRSAAGDIRTLVLRIEALQDLLKKIDDQEEKKKGVRYVVPQKETK